MVRAYTKKYNEEHKEEKLRKGRIHSKVYYRSHKIQRREYNIQLWRRIKLSTLEAIGGATCVKCGFHDLRALQIDHINGGGRKHMASFSSNKTYLRHVRDKPKEFKVLFANLNWI